MNAAQMSHQRIKAGLEQLLADGRKRTPKQRAELQRKLDMVLDYERKNPWIVG